jgi:glycosyltransferase involved in cell wall biosynthesis
MSPPPGPAGSERDCRLGALACALAAGGHVVDVFTRRNDLWSAPVVALAPNANVVQLAAGPPYFVPPQQLPGLMADFAARFVGACGVDDYDVVHAADHLAALAALRLRERCNVPFVLGLSDAVSPFGDDRIALAADRVIAFDPDGHDRLTARYRGTAARIESIPAAVDTAAFAPASRAARARFGLRADEFVVVQRARLARPAGIDTGIRAIGALRRTHGVAARLLVAATAEACDPRADEELARLRGVAARAGVLGQVAFVGAGPPAALRETYAAADAALAVPTDSPAAGSPLEPMACGVPVVGADVGAIRWAIQDEVTGFLVPTEDPTAIAERLARLHRNPELGRAYGRAGVRRVRAGFTWRHAAAALARIYAAVLAPHRARLATAASR